VQLPAGILEQHHARELPKLAQDETVPAKVRHDITSTMAGWRRSRELVADLKSQAVANKSALKRQRLAAVTVLVEKLTASDKQPNMAAITSDVKALEVVASDLERSISIAERAADMTVRRITTPLARWGVDGWKWCAQQRVAAGMNGSAESHVVYAWQGLSRPVIVPWPIVQSAPGKVPIDAKRTPSLQPYPIDEQQLLRMTGRKPTDRTSELVPQLQRSLLGFQADWFALLCIAHGRVEERAGHWYATARSDEYDELQQLMDLQPVS
jgi:hypothetical protein